MSPCIYAVSHRVVHGSFYINETCMKFASRLSKHPCAGWSDRAGGNLTDGFDSTLCLLPASRSQCVQLACRRLHRRHCHCRSGRCRGQTGRRSQRYPPSAVMNPADLSNDSPVRLLYGAQPGLQHTSHPLSLRLVNLPRPQCHPTHLCRTVSSWPLSRFALIIKHINTDPRRVSAATTKPCAEPLTVLVGRSPNELTWLWL